MKTTIIALLKALVAIAAGAADLAAPGILDKTTSLKHRITAGALAILLILLIILATGGCQATTYLDGKTYSWRMDILTPIGQTANGFAPKAPQLILMDPNK